MCAGTTRSATLASAGTVVSTTGSAVEVTSGTLMVVTEVKVVGPWVMLRSASGVAVVLAITIRVPPLGSDNAHAEIPGGSTPVVVRNRRKVPPSRPATRRSPLMRGVGLCCVGMAWSTGQSGE